MTKGQLTMEYLVLAALSLALISFSLFSLLKISEVEENTRHIQLFKSSAIDLYNTGEELCAMGSGNSFTLHIYESVEISSDSHETIFLNSKYNSSFSKTTSCQFISITIPENSLVQISNFQGSIRIEVN
ncbi:hypothetical protein KJ780_00140 [Candidatus Micrarchaeota archaeon]|nr:hypothetical protein [Candidatus Micrarchaeota archaeon]